MLPVFEAQYTVVIASKTGWSEEFIRWQLPLWRGMAYYHAARVLEGEKCRWPGERGAVGRWLDRVKGWVRKSAKSTRRG